jgi:hypothetical protein
MQTNRHAWHRDSPDAHQRLRHLHRFDRYPQARNRAPQPPTLQRALIVHAFDWLTAPESVGRRSTARKTPVSNRLTIGRAKRRSALLLLL